MQKFHPCVSPTISWSHLQRHLEYLFCGHWLFWFPPYFWITSLVTGGHLISPEGHNWHTWGGGGCGSAEVPGIQSLAYPIKRTRQSVGDPDASIPDFPSSLTWLPSKPGCRFLHLLFTHAAIQMSPYLVAPIKALWHYGWKPKMMPFSHPLHFIPPLPQFLLPFLNWRKSCWSPLFKNPYCIQEG